MTEAPSSPVVPHLVVKGGKAAISFYEKAFGAQCLFSHPAEDGERLLHASLSINGGTVMLHDEFPEYGDGGVAAPRTGGTTTVTIHLNVDDADKWWDRAIKAGAEVVFPLEDQFWGERYGKLRDPFGHIWSLLHPLTQ